MGIPPGANSPLLSPPKRADRTWALSTCVSIAYPLAVDLAGTRLRQLVLHEDLLWHHVRWTILYNVLSYLLYGSITIPEGDYRVDLLPYLRVFHPEGARLAHLTGAHQKSLHFLRAQAVALRLYHRVVAPHEVARVDHPLHVQKLRWGHRVRTIRLARRLLLAPVAHRYRRAPVYQLARLAGGALLTISVYDQDLGVRDRLADAGGTAFDFLGWQIRRAERFG